MVSISGCTGDPAGFDNDPSGSENQSSPEENPRDDALFVLVEEHIWVNATHGGRIRAELGPPCAPAHYSEDAATVYLFHESDAPSGVLVRDYVNFDPARDQNITTILDSEGQQVHLFNRSGDVVQLLSPVDPDRTLLDLVIEDDDDVIVNGTLLDSGREVVHRFDHVTHDEDGRDYTVTEILRIRNIGGAHVTVPDQPGSCD